MLKKIPKTEKNLKCPKKNPKSWKNYQKKLLKKCRKIENCKKYDC